MQQEAVEYVLAAHGIFDLGFLVVFAELGEVNDFEAAAKVAVAVDFEHYLLGVADQVHGAMFSIDCSVEHRFSSAFNKSFPRRLQPPRSNFPRPQALKRKFNCSTHALQRSAALLQVVAKGQ